MNTLFNYTKSTLLLLAFSFTLLGCTNEILDLQENELSARNGTQFKFNTTLSGKNTVPVQDTHAVGQAIVTISKDETKIHYKIITANIDDIFASHFHLAPVGENGGIVAPLYGNAPSGPNNGVLAEGYITVGDVIGPLSPDPDDPDPAAASQVALANLIIAIRSGNIYVNVHTLAVLSGEIRGQL